MSTNYFARILPSKERIKDLQKAVELSVKGENWSLLYSLTRQTYDLRTPWNEGGQVHLGKRALGWKFLWNSNIREKVVEWSEDHTPLKYDYEYIYPLTHEGIANFIMREDVVIINEYEEVQDKKQFLNMAFSWKGMIGKDWLTIYPKEEVWIGKEAAELIKRAGYTPQYNEFINDGLRFSTALEFD